MHDIAKDAGVAIGTLYRYFPSKVVLFTTLLHSQVNQLDAVTRTFGPGQTAAGTVADVMMYAGGQLMRHPLLAQAMLQANNMAVAGESGGVPVTSAFVELILRAAGVSAPTPHDHRLVRLAEQTWYGVLISQLNGLISADEAEADTRLACRLLLADLGQSVGPATSR